MVEVETEEATKVAPLKRKKKEKEWEKKGGKEWRKRKRSLSIAQP